jgi:hypothetical protein
MDCRPTGRHLDRNAAPLELVRALTLDFTADACGTPQLDLALEGLDVLERRKLGLLDHLPLAVAGRRTEAEPDLRLVALVEPDEVAGQAGRGAEQDEQEAARERVERPGVSRLHAVLGAQPLDDRERRRADRLVHQHQPLHGAQP